MPEDLSHIDARIDRARLIGLLEDIQYEAQNHPQRLIAFNSPLLQLAVMEIYCFHHPEAWDDYALEMQKMRYIINQRRKAEHS